MTTINWKKLSWWVGGLILLAALAAPELSNSTVKSSDPALTQSLTGGPVDLVSSVPLR